jgi:hypothetical protein
MKKIVCLVLALVFAFSFVSCGEDGAEAFISIAKSSQPTVIITQTSYNDGDVNFAGRFKTTISETETVMEYTYQRYATIEEGVLADDPEGYIKTVEGVVYVKDGKYSTDGENWFVELPDDGVLQVKLNLTVKNLGKYEISKDGKTLKTNITAEDAEAILGISVPATEDGVNLEIVHDGTLLRSISVTYATETAESVSIETSYAYGKVSSSEDAQ